MSSITDRPRERGQALVVFALSLVLVMIVAALGYDTGMIMLGKRDQQNAADAAALAGVRLLPNRSAARTRAWDIAAANGFDDADDSVAVQVFVSATRIDVRILEQMPSLFAGVIGISTWDVSASAAAVKMDDSPMSAAMMALSPDACPAFKITGSGRVSTNGDIQVNSSCAAPDGDAFLISGQGDLFLGKENLGCYVVGDAEIGGKGSGSYCDPPQTGAPPVSYPVQGSPFNTTTPATPVRLVDNGKGLKVPARCPGGTNAATDAAPASCQFSSTYSGSEWRLFPGYYPGGINLQGGKFYMEPGIYHLAGGGLKTSGGGVTLISVDAGTTNLGGGVLLFNSTHPIASPGGIQLSGGDSTAQLLPLNYDPTCEEPSGPWDRYLIFQDPANSQGISINGSSSDMIARGLIYAPTADVTLNGNGGTLIIDAVIASTFQINGGGGNINVEYDACNLPTFTGYGLIE